MTKGTWTIVFVLAVIIIAALLFMAFRQNSKNQKREKCPDGKTPVPKNGVCPSESVINPVADEAGCINPAQYQFVQFPVKKGMKDGGAGQDRVSHLQRKLNEKYNAGLEVDGFFGCLTEGALKKYLGVTEIYTNNNIWS